MIKQELLKKIDAYEYVSFDLYDTLVFRATDEPSDVWRIAQDIFNEKRKTNKVRLFRQKRTLAEKIARKRNGLIETNLDDIYRYLPFKEATRNELKKIEMMLEESITVQNKEMISVIEYCHQKHKKVLITTDMYLPRSVIESILKKNQISYDYLFISCEIGRTKYSGLLYPIVLDSLNIDGSKIIHLGDNPISDIQNARNYKIESELRLTSENNTISRWFSELNHIPNSFLRKYIELNLCQRENITSEYVIGYANIGPLTYEICKFISAKAKEKKIDTIAFVAREGFLLYEAYKKMFPEEAQLCKYIRLNKNVLRMPILYLDASVKNFLSTIPSHHEYEWGTLCSYFPNKVDSELKPSSIVKKEDLLSGKYDKDFNLIFEKNRPFFEDQYKLLITYLKENDLLNKRILLVNNSINGNGQIMLETIIQRLNLSVTMFGFQFTKSKKCSLKLKDRVYACITESKLANIYDSMFDYCTLLFEHLFFEQKGTSLRMKNTVPVSICCDDIGEESNNEGVMRQIQGAAIDFVNDYQKCNLPLRETVFKLFFDMYLNPSIIDASVLGGICVKEADSSGKLMDIMNWKQAKMVLDNQNVKFYNYTMSIKCFIKNILIKLNLFKY